MEIITWKKNQNNHILQKNFEKWRLTFYRNTSQYQLTDRSEHSEIFSSNNISLSYLINK